MDMIINGLVAAASFYIGAIVLRGVEVRSFWQALLVAITVAVLDVTLGTILKIVTLGLLSLGIFNWLLNAILILVADWFLPDFKVKNFWWALALAAVVSMVGSAHYWHEINTTSQTFEKETKHRATSWLHSVHWQQLWC